MINTETYLKFTRIESVELTDRGLIAHLHGEKFRIDLIDVDVARLKISQGGMFDEKPTHALAAEPLPEHLVEFQFKLEQASATITTAAMRIVVGLEPFAVDVYRADGSVVFETARDAEGQPKTFQTLNDAWALHRKTSRHDGVYGLGEKAGRQNRKGRDFTLWNTDVLNPTASGEFTEGRDAKDPRSDNTSSEFDPFYISIPFFYMQDATNNVMGSWIDNSYRAHYDFIEDDEYQIQFDGGQYTEYVFAAPSMSRILEQYTRFTGRNALPPMWALGYHQCRWKGYAQAEVLALAAKHRELDVPIDTLWLDIDYMDGYRVFTWNNELYPNPKQMLEELREDNIGVITIIDPGVKHDPGYAVYDDGVAKDVFAKTPGGNNYIGQVWPGDTVFPDFTKPETREWWGALNAEHVRSGLSGIWNDMNEPATGNISPNQMLFSDGKFEHARYHNEYALLMAMGTVDGLKDAMPALRTFVLSRAGSPGIQRYAANWLGDNFARWDHLWVSVPMGTGLSLSGQSFVGADIGGFAEDTNAELFLRWIQYATLTPFARNHSVINTIDQYVWSFGKEVLDAAREAIKLRYRLLPYIYSAFVKHTLTGEPIQRPLIFDYQHDSKVRDLDTEFLFGQSLLVAPVLQPDAKKLDVYLPAGEWFDFATDEYFESTTGQTLQVELRQEGIPVFAKAGSVIAMWPDAPKSARGYQPEELELHVYVPEAHGVYESMLQEDDGTTFAAELDGYKRTNFTLTKSADQVLLEGKVTGVGYADFKRTKFVIVVHQANMPKRTIKLANTGESFVLDLND